MPRNAPVVADRQRGGIDVVDAGSLARAAGKKHQQWYEDTWLERNEALVGGQTGKGLLAQGEHHPVIEVLEVAIAPTVLQHHDGHDLACRQPALRATLPGLPCAQLQQCPRQENLLAEIVHGAKYFNESVKHTYLHP